MTARYLFVEDLSLVGLSEDAMIAYFHPLGLDSWGKMGFGSKATGFGRAGQASEWHEANPPDLSFPVQAGHTRPKTLRQLVAIVAQGGPLVLSVPDTHRIQFDQDHPSANVVPPRELPFQEWIREIESKLARGWRIDKRPMAWYIVPDSIREP
jgi:hypothetical protein